MEYHFQLSAYNRNVGDKTKAWQDKVDGKTPPQQQAASSSKYHGMLHMQKLSGHDDTYGRPAEGSKTEYRGKQAGVRISNEVVELCDVIENLGVPQKDGTFAVTFGVLFEAYTRISNKLVGMLMRARKQKLIDFKGEMLFQRRDDDVIIRLIRRPDDLREDIEQRKGELAHHAAVAPK